MNDDDASWEQVVSRWRGDAEYRSAFVRRLLDGAPTAVAWETNPVSAATRDRAYAQVVLPEPALARAAPDRAAFAEHFAGGEPIVTFDNLGGDARLVVPAPVSPDTDYAHLAAFLRTAPDDQVHALWQAVGDAVHAHWRTSDAPVWVSTAGLGVFWLHVRLDRRPKYYRHAPFRAPPPRSTDDVVS